MASAFGSLPDTSQPSVDFLDSSWFRTHQRLPSPEDVRSRPDKKRNFVIFEELDLFVKFGDTASTTEGSCLWAIKRYLNDEIPVPEVYGWKVDAGEVFLYMQLIRGPTLLERWQFLSHNDKQVVCNDLRVIVSRLRELGQTSPDQGISTITGEPLKKDRVLEFQPGLRTFTNVSAFHDWLSWVWRAKVPDWRSIPDPWRDLLSDRSYMCFTHGDLHQSNIIITPTSPPRVAALVDWEQAGWYPEYWEYCKAMYTAGYWEEWRKDGWIDSFLQPYPSAFEAFMFYVDVLGAY